MQDEAQADRSGLRAAEEVLRDADGREPEAAEGTPGAEGPQTGPALPHAHAGGDHHHVPLM